MKKIVFYIFSAILLITYVAILFLSFDTSHATEQYRDLYLNDTLCSYAAEEAIPHPLS